jgi:cellulose synthase/poly-beta-1,6-N-acetylglucosamine synthase-like glycosyltransferase
MTDYPSVSVIVCIYNATYTLSATINSLIDQDYPLDKIEIILVNDGSNNNSESVCLGFINRQRSRMPKITYVRQLNSGLGGARNTGISMSDAEIIAFIDQDAVADKNWIKELVTCFGTNAKIGVAGGKIEILNNWINFSRFIHWAYYYGEDSKGNEYLPIVGTNMAFRGSVFEQLGGFYENFKSSGDETSLLNSKILHNYQSIGSKLAIVWHERPWTLSQWLKERFRNGHEHALERKVRNIPTMKNISYSILRGSSLLLLPSLYLSLMTGSNLALLTLMFVSINIIYRCFFRESLLVRIRILKRKYSNYKLPFLFVIYATLVVLGKMIDDYGLLLGAFKYRNETARDSISKQKIIERISNI